MSDLEYKYNSEFLSFSNENPSLGNSSPSLIFDHQFLSEDSESIFKDDESENSSDQLIFNQSENPFGDQISNSPNPTFSATKRIHKQTVIFISPADYKRKLIQLVKLLDEKDLTENTAITFEPFGREDQNQETTCQEVKEFKEEKKGDHKNLTKILGNAIISFAFNRKNSDFIEKEFLKKMNPFFFENYGFELNKIRFSMRDFYDWMSKKNLKKEFVKLDTFRLVWDYKEPVYGLENIRNQYYCMVLKRISRYFLKNKFIQHIFEKVSAGSTRKQNANCYLEKMTVFVRGLKEPKNLKNIVF